MGMAGWKKLLTSRKELFALLKVFTMKHPLDKFDKNHCQNCETALIQGILCIPGIPSISVLLEIDIFG